MQQIIESSIKSIARQTIIDQLKEYSNTKKLSEICQVVKNKVADDFNDKDFTYDNKHIYVSKQFNITFYNALDAPNAPCHYTIILNNYDEKTYDYLLVYLNIAGLYVESIFSLLDLEIPVLDETENWNIYSLSLTNKCIEGMLELCLV
jgi:hypothetical protein